MSRILVTGGEGFIGKHLIKVLKRKKHDISVIDLKLGTDIRNLDDYPKGKFDIIYHLAANADVRGGKENTEVDFNNNIVGTYTLLEFMRKSGCKKLVFTSSATIYGEREDLPTKEDAGNLEPISLYGASKLACEKLIMAYCHTFKIKAWIFRLGNVIGYGNTHGVINDFVNKLKETPDTLKVLGNGYQIKQFLDVSDCIKALCHLPKFDGYINIYNLAHSQTIMIKDLAKWITNDINYNYCGPDYIAIEYENYDRGWVGDVPITIIDNTKLKKTGWYEDYSPYSAVLKTIGYLMKK